VRATSATLTRRYSGELPPPTGPAPTAIAANRYDPAGTPLEVSSSGAACARPTRAIRACDIRGEAGLHFLRMLELQSPSKSYRAAFLTSLALQPFTTAGAVRLDEATSRYMQSMVGRAPDGRRLAATLRTTGAAQLRAGHGIEHAAADRPKVQQGGNRVARVVRLDVQRARGPTDVPGIRRGSSMRCRSARACRPMLRTTSHFGDRNR